MKLRIKGNTIRIRLSQTEVDMLASGKTVLEETYFPSSTLRFEVLPADSTSADIKDNSVIISLSRTAIQAWAKTAEVSISENISITENNILSILVEKDFKCLTVRPEDESELFPNPNQEHSNN
jgi:hypothetical protein